MNRNVCVPQLVSVKLPWALATVLRAYLSQILDWQRFEFSEIAANVSTAHCTLLCTVQLKDDAHEV